MKSLVFAAGLGTRLRPLTDTMPKALVPVGGRPLLDITLRRLISEGATEVVVNVHHFADQVTAYLAARDYGIPVRVSDETRLLLDTGGGLRKALALFETEPDAPILIHNVDILSDAPLARFYAACREADAALLVSPRPSTRQLYFDNAMRLRGWQNLTTGATRSPLPHFSPDAHTPYAFSGIHLFSPRLLRALEAYGERFPIMDFYLGECARADIRGHLLPALRLMDVGKADTLERAKDFAEELGLATQ
ncbi:MAG: nucleotidyltransferase family protein [Bacteroidaceae bacterium]|nr:nucleotidyltransferase family protein [Bacteroidaceae bacterium]